MVALTGPSSITSAPVGAMNRASEVPPAVESSGSMPDTSRTAAVTASRSGPPRVRNGAAECCQSISRRSPCRSSTDSTRSTISVWVRAGE